MRIFRRRTFFLKNTDSPVFNGADLGQSTLVYEADRIIRESLGKSALGKRRDRSNSGGFLLPFFLGMLTIFTLSLILYFVFNLF